MLIAYSMPPVTSLALAGGSGAAWLTSDGYAALFDGKPARRARLRWRDSAVPATSHYVALQVGFAVPTPLRVIAVLGLRGIPEGVKLEARGREVGAPSATALLGGTALTQRTAMLPDGTTGAWLLGDATSTAYEGFELRIYNDASGVTWANAATTIDLGELFAAPAVSVPIQPDWRFSEPGTTRQRARTRAAQLASAPGQEFRRLGVTAQPQSKAIARGGGLPHGMDWSRLQAALRNDARAAAIPRWRTPTGAIDAGEVQATALYGIAEELGEIQHLGGDYYAWNPMFEEIPAPF
jgi:hypothetical protein